LQTYQSEPLTHGPAADST